VKEHFSAVFGGDKTEALINQIKLHSTNGHTFSCLTL
jgi:hypothetical protein